MSKAKEHIRVSTEVKHELERRKREGESFDDVIERILDEDRDLLSGVGFWSEEHADKVRKERREAKEKRKRRVLGEDGEDEK